MSNSSTPVTVTITTPEGREFTFSSAEYVFLTATIGQVYFTADRERLKEIEHEIKEDKR